MTTMTITTGSIANVSAALVSIGFTADPNDNTKLYWTNDTNHKLYIKLITNSSNTQIAVYNSSNAEVSGLTKPSFSNTASWKLTYEIIGNSIIFGFRLLSDSYNNIQFIIVEPSDNTEEWLYCYPGNTGYATGGNSQTSMQMCTYYLYNGSTSGVQIVKAYYGGKFVNNLFVTAYSPFIAKVGESNNNNYATATIAGNEYILINLTANANYTKYAVKRNNNS